MLKEEELFDFIRRDDAANIRQTRAAATSREADWNVRYDSFSADLAALGREYDALIQLDDLSEDDEERLEALEEQLDGARTTLVGIIEALSREFADQGGQAAIAFGRSRLDALENRQQTLAKLGHGAALISTVITDERLHLILTTPEIQLARQSPIGSKPLNALIGRFRQALMTATPAPPLSLARELYGHLIGPIAADSATAAS